MALFTPSLLSPTVPQNLPKPFVTCGYLSPKTSRNTGFLLFQKKCLGGVSLSSWIHPYMIAVVYSEKHIHCFFQYRSDCRTSISSSSWDRRSPLLPPSPSTPHFPPIWHLQSIYLVNLALEFEVKKLHR